MATFRLAASLAKLFTQVNEIAPKRKKASDGWIGDSLHWPKGNKSDHNPWVKEGSMGIVTAIDITNDPGNGCNAMAIVDDLVASRDPRIKYVIHREEIWRSYDKPGVSAWKPGAYKGSNPHNKHVHISVYDKKSLYDDQSLWSLPTLANTAGVMAFSGTETDASTMNIAWGKKVSSAFKARTIEISQALGIDPNDLMAVMAFESARTFSPSIQNPSSKATGLIQFMPKTAVGLGTTTAKLAAMSAVHQLDYVYAYLKPFKGKALDIYDLYMCVLWPAAVGKPKSYVLFAHPKKAYKLNSGLDTNDDLVVTKAEAASKVVARLTEGMAVEWLG